MRTTTGVLFSALALAACNGPAAMADPTALPEVPAGGRMLFIDSPDLVDPHPAAIESWSRAADDSAVAVNFASGTPACSAVHATVQETEDTVTVDLQSGTLPQAVGRMCIMLEVFGTLDVPLQAPLGDRRVLSAS